MKSYIKYLKRQNKHIQDMHAIFWASIFTLIVIVAVLQYRYNIFYPEYKRLEQDTNIKSSSSNIPDDIYNKYTIVESFNNIISNTKNIIKGAGTANSNTYHSSSTNR